MTSIYACDSVSTDPNSFESEPVSYQLLPSDVFALDPRMAATLEYNWGLPRGGLDLDAFLNHIQVRADLPALLTAGRLCFVPTLKTLQTITSQMANNSEEKPRLYTEAFPVQTYEHILAPTFIQTPLYIRMPGSDHLERFEHPYHGLPTFTSSAHPFHVIHQSMFCVLAWRRQLEARYSWGASICKTLINLDVHWMTEPSPELFCYNSEDDEAASSSGDSELYPGPLMPPRRVKTKPVRQCYSYLDSKSINSWITETQVAGYGTESVVNSPDVRLNGYRDEPYRSIPLVDICPSALQHKQSDDGQDSD